MSKELGLNVELPLPFEAAVTRVREALKQEGFGVLTEIDLRAAFREKLGREFRPYVTREGLTLSGYGSACEGGGHD